MRKMRPSLRSTLIISVFLFSPFQASAEDHVTSGYEPRLNAFAGDIPGFQKKFDEERSKRDALQIGAAVTNIMYLPAARNKYENGCLMGIMYKSPDQFIAQIRSFSGQFPIKIIGGQPYWVRGSSGNPNDEKSYSSIIDKTFVVVACDQFETADAVISALDVAGLKAFQQ